MSSRDEEIDDINVKWNAIDMVRGGDPHDIVEVATMPRYGEWEMELDDEIVEILIRMPIHKLALVVPKAEWRLEALLLRAAPHYTDPFALTLISDLVGVDELYEVLHAHREECGDYGEHTLEHCIALWKPPQ
jgi:hypothetical protein